MNAKSKKLPGLHVQWPWSQLLLSGKKTIETRSYKLPKKYEGVELALIETPGPKGKRLGGIVQARIIGTITFSGCFQYESKRAWQGDRRSHCVDLSDPQYAWGSSAERWAWQVESLKKLKTPKPAPKKRGIVFALNCEI